jgi:nucleoside-diphosphate-sugar epimerase
MRRRDVHLSQADIRDPQALAEMTAVHPDTVVHLATIHFIPACKRSGARVDTNTHGTVSVIPRVRRLSFRFASSAASPPSHVPW